jgi:uncharacterized protein (TIGR00645 family)
MLLMSSRTGKASNFRERLEVIVEVLLFGGRWLLAPLYVGLVVSLIALVYKFVGSLWHLMTDLPQSDLHSTTLGVLELLDITLLGNLIVIVIFSGYENFVSKIGIATNSKDRPSWMGKVDYSGLKIKLIGSLVAISVIELLKDFMEKDTLDPDVVMWRIAIHITFVVSGLLFAIMDYIADKRIFFEIEAEKKVLEVEQLKYEIGQKYPDAVKAAEGVIEEKL